MEQKIRYCKSCEARTIHDVKPETSTAEKVFFGVGTLGMLPLMEALTKDAPAGPSMFAKIWTCQRCDSTTIVDR